MKKFFKAAGTYYTTDGAQAFAGSDGPGGVKAVWLIGLSEVQDRIAVNRASLAAAAQSATMLNGRGEQDIPFSDIISIGVCETASGKGFSGICVTTKSGKHILDVKREKDAAKLSEQLKGFIGL